MVVNTESIVQVSLVRVGSYFLTVETGRVASFRLSHARSFSVFSATCRPNFACIWHVKLHDHVTVQMFLYRDNNLVYLTAGARLMRNHVFR